MSSWPSVPIRRLFRVVNGGTPTGEPDNWNGGVPWATPVDLAKVDSGVLESTERTLTATGLRTGSRTVPAGSIVVSTRAPIGYVAQVEASTAFNQGCRGLGPAAPMDIRFFRYQLSVSSGQLAALGQGSTFVELSSEQLAGFPVVAPPQDQQRSIADYLDRETARLDALIAAKQRMIDLVQERSASHRHRWYQELAEQSVPVPLRRLMGRLEQGWSPVCDSAPAEDDEWGVIKTAAPRFGWVRRSLAQRSVWRR